MSLQVWRRRRNALLVFGAITAGGYVSYRVYKSQYVSRKRKHISGFLQSFSRLTGAVVDGTDCAAIVVGDLKKFLLSEEEEVPRSVKQVFKVLKCQEFQEAVVSLSHLLLLGKIGGLQARKDETSSYNVSARKISAANASFDDEETKRNRTFGIQSEIQMNKPSGTDYVDRTIDDVEGEDLYPIQKVCYVEGHSVDKKVFDRGSCAYDHRNSGSEGTKDCLFDIFMDKLFSERGKGFASALVGCAARNLVYSGFEVMRRCLNMETKRGSASLSPDICEVQQEGGEKLFALHSNNTFQRTQSSANIPLESSENSSTNMDSILDLACDGRSRSLIAECIEKFVATAVSVYLVKTRDVNVYEELAAGLTKPFYQARVTELLRSVSSGAVETLVRTSHEVLSTGSSYSHNRSDICNNEHEKMPKICPESSVVAPLKSDSTDVSDEQSTPPTENGNTASIHEMEEHNIKTISCSSEKVDLMESQNASVSHFLSTSTRFESTENQDLGGRCLVPSSQVFNAAVSRRCDRANGVPFYLIDGLSKALAVPNNRKLVIEVAGAMTSEAVRSFFGVICNILRVGYAGQSKSQELAGTSSLHAPYRVKSRDITKTLALNSLVVVTLWLAVVMHFTSGVLNPI